MWNSIRRLRGFLGQRKSDTAGGIYRRRGLRFETIEHRRLLSANAADAIMGIVFADANANDTFDVGEGIEGASLMLYLDNGDGIFDPNNGDVQIGSTTTTDANGDYSFTDLDQSATYFVLQPQQSVSGQILAQQDSGPIRFTPQLIIDEFVTTQTTVAIPPPISSDSSSLAFADETEVLGAERDLFVELTEGMSEVQLRVNPFNQQDVLLFDSSAGTTGLRVVTWDGQDNDGEALALGLNGVDLTQGGTLTSFTMLMGVDANGGSAAIRIYQGNTTTPSEVTVAIPQTNGTASVWVNIPFSSLSGPVSADNVDAIVLELLTGSSSVDGQIDVIGAAGARVADFDNDVSIDLELTKTVDANEVHAGDTVTWTVSLLNNDSTATVGDGGATATATGVVVSDVLPTGVSFGSSTATNGTFANGIWTLSGGIAPGEQETLTLVTTVKPGLAGGSTLTNTAQVAAHEQPDIDSTPNNDDGDQSEDDEDNAQVTVGTSIDLEVTKVANTADVEPGGQVTFTITITNNADTANASATGVEVTDALPTGMTLVSATPSGNGIFDTGTLVWSLVDPLAPGAQQTLTIVADVNAGVAGDSTLSNVAQVTAANETDVDSTPANDDGDQSEDDEDMAMFTVDAVIDLALTKTASAETIAPGDVITWVLNVTNDEGNANAAATNVQVTDVMPDGLTVTSGVPSGNGTFANGIWSLVDPLPPGSTATLTLTTTVNNDIQVGDHINTAQVTAADQADFDSTPGNDDGDQSEDDEAADAVTVEPRIDLEVAKTVDQSTVLTGNEVTWTITVTNNDENANSAATGVTIGDVVPTGLTVSSATTANGTFANDVWTLANPLEPDASATLTLITTVDSGTTLTTIENVAQVRSANETDFDSTPNNDDGDQSEDDEDIARISVTPSQIDLELTKSANVSQADPGDTVNWTITLSNNGTNANSAATGVTVTDVLPLGVSLVSSTPSIGTFAGETWNVGTLAAGQSATLTLSTTVGNSINGGTIITNTAQVATAVENDVDSTPGNDNGDQSEDDEANAFVTVRSVVDLELVKSVEPTSVQVDENVTWTVVVTNNAANANAAATGVTVSDVMPLGATFLSAAATLGAYNSVTGVWTLGAGLEPGQSATLTVVTSIDNSSGGQTLVNSAQVATQEESDVDSTPGDGMQNDDDDDTAELTVALQRPMSKRSLLATS